MVVFCVHRYRSTVFHCAVCVWRTSFALNTACYSSMDAHVLACAINYIGLSSSQVKFAIGGGTIGTNTSFRQADGKFMTRKYPEIMSSILFTAEKYYSSSMYAHGAEKVVIARSLLL